MAILLKECKIRHLQLPQLRIQSLRLFPEIHVKGKPNYRIEYNEDTEHADETFQREWNPSYYEGNDEV